MEFKDLDQLYAYVEKEISKSLQEDVAPIVKEAERKNVYLYVYDVYNIVDGKHQDPYMYVRRKTNGGLADIKNMVDKIDVVNGNVILSITNETRGQQQTDLYIAPLVEYGNGAGYGNYQYPFNRDNTQEQFLQARPFTAETIRQLDQDGIHIETLKDSLLKKGFNFA